MVQYFLMDAVDSIARVYYLNNSSMCKEYHIKNTIRVQKLPSSKCKVSFTKANQTDLHFY